MEFPGSNDMRNSMHVPVGRPSRRRRKLLNFENRSLGLLSNILLFGGILLVLVVVFYSAFGSNITGEAKQVNKKEYQAVFLANTTTLQSVYFGKITSINEKYVVLEDIFYINQQSTSDATQTKSSQYQLIKLGKEIHAPQDKMIINRNQVLFWENLQDSSQVVTKIKEYKANPSAANSSTSSSSQNQSSSTKSTQTTTKD